MLAHKVWLPDTEVDHMWKVAKSEEAADNQYQISSAFFNYALLLLVVVPKMQDGDVGFAFVWFCTLASLQL